jgi:hypothetical protein
MATKKNADNGENAVVTDSETTVSEEKYRLKTLEKHCRKLFGVSTATFTGATSGIDDGEYTVKEIKGIIEEWCNKEVD